MPITLATNIRRMIVKDVPDLMHMQQVIYGEMLMDAEQWRGAIKCDSNYCLAAVDCGHIVGFTILVCGDSWDHDLLWPSVMPAVRRLGVGRQLVGHAQMITLKGDRVISDLNESQTEAHLFMRACGFRAIKVIRDYQGSDQTIYRFSWEQS